jgi:hypothetical protein
VLESLQVVLRQHWWMEPATWTLPVIGAVAWAFVKWVAAMIQHARDFVSSRNL